MGTPPNATIVGVATGSPDGGVAIVRLSGSAAFEIAAGLVEGELPEARRLGARRLVLGEGTREQALVVTMAGPNSFTGEDVVELHVHGGRANVAEVLDALVREGAQAAGPGDFTRRAFAHGRLGLDQAEGVAAIVEAQTREALQHGRRLLAGELGEEVVALDAAVFTTRVEIEAHLDFPEDVPEERVRGWVVAVEHSRAGVEAWCAGFDAGRRAREGARVVIAGPPNAGKSALFNALLRQPRALVAEVPGTTRDYVESRVRFGGREIVLVDTAGLRDAREDAIEARGIDRSEEQARGADVVLWVEASDAAPSDVELGTSAPVVRVENKRDLGSARAEWVGAVSAGEGLDVQAVQEAIVEELNGGPMPWIGLARHEACARVALEALDEARAGLAEGSGLELVAFSLQVASARLGEIIGKPTGGAIGEDVLDAIFSRFCIGK